MIQLYKRDNVTLQMRVRRPPSMAPPELTILRNMREILNHQKSSYCLLPRNQMRKEMLVSLYMTLQCHYVKVNFLVYAELWVVGNPLLYRLFLVW